MEDNLEIITLNKIKLIKKNIWDFFIYLRSKQVIQLCYLNACLTLT